MSRNELADLVDDGDGVEVALALGLAPGEEAVAAENNAIAAGVGAEGIAHHEAKFKAGALPRNPDQRVVELAIEFVHLRFAVGRGGESNAPVRMEMVDVREGKKAVQRRIDGRGDGVVAEGAHGIHRHHVVFGLDAFVAALECEELVLVEGGEAGALDAAEVAAGAFDPDDFDGFAGEGVGLSNFGTGVAAGKVGDAQVGAEQVGAIAQKLGFVERSGDGGIPAVFKEAEGCGCESCLRHSAPPEGPLIDSPEFNFTAHDDVSGVAADGGLPAGAFASDSLDISVFAKSGERVGGEAAGLTP